MRYYKLTDQNNTTMNNTVWGEGVTHTATSKGTLLCTTDVIHVYDHPLKAAMFNRIHANIENPILWACRVKRVVANDYLKAGVKECTTVRQIPLLKITIEQRVRFAILCALEVYSNTNFVKWANDWLSGIDRSANAAYAAYAANTALAANAATNASASLAAYAANASYAASKAALAALTANASSYAANAAYAAYAAASLAAYAANASIDIVALIKKAIRDENRYMKETK